MDADQEQEELDKAFRDVMSLASGKRVMFWILAQCEVYADPDCGEFTHGTATKIGAQKIGRKLIGKLDSIDPRLYPKLLLEIADMKAMAQAAQQENDDDLDG